MQTAVALPTKMATAMVMREMLASRIVTRENTPSYIKLHHMAYGQGVGLIGVGLIMLMIRVNTYTSHGSTCVCACVCSRMLSTSVCFSVSRSKECERCSDKVNQLFIDVENLQLLDTLSHLPSLF